jgi:hypothetical protein
MAKPLLEIERELARQRRLSTLKRGDKLPDRQNFAERETGEAFSMKRRVQPMFV